MRLRAAGMKRDAEASLVHVDGAQGKGRGGGPGPLRDAYDICMSCLEYFPLPPACLTHAESRHTRTYSAWRYHGGAQRHTRTHARLSSSSSSSFPFDEIPPHCSSIQGSPPLAPPPHSPRSNSACAATATAANCALYTIVAHRPVSSYRPAIFI